MMQGDVAPAPVVPMVEPVTEVKARPVSMARGTSDVGEKKVEEDKSTKRVSLVSDEPIS